jgi:putative oxidoreductase
MSQFVSTRYTASAVNGALLFLRLGAAILMIPHGYQKLSKFETMQTQFVSFLGMGPKVSLILAISAELGCSLLLLIGLFTRLATIPLIITMLTALFVAHGGAIFDEGVTSVLFFLIYAAILMIGPGTYSVDAKLDKRRF